MGPVFECIHRFMLGSFGIVIVECGELISEEVEFLVIPLSKIEHTDDMGDDKFTKTFQWIAVQSQRHRIFYLLIQKSLAITDENSWKITQFRKTYCICLNRYHPNIQTEGDYSRKYSISKFHHLYHQ